MRSLETITISIEGLRANTLRTVLTVLGIIIGVSTVVLLISLSLEVRSQITGSIKSLGSNVIFILPANPQSYNAIFTASKLRPRHVKEIVQKSSYNVTVSPLISKTAIVKYGKKSRSNTLITGTSPDYASMMDWKVVRGRFLKKSDLISRRKICVIGQDVNKNLFSNVDAVGRNLIINGRNFKVVGIMDKKGLLFSINFDDQVFLPITTSQKFFNTNELDSITAKVSSEKQIEPAVVEIRKILAKQLDENDFYVQSQGKSLDILNKITSILTIMLGAIASISLVVGGIGIMNIMTVSVTERTKEIGIRKAVGAKDSDILFQFLAEAIIISLLGGIIGIIASYLVAYLISSLYPTFHLSISYDAVIIAILFSFSMGTFFGVYPAYKAANLDPIIALHYE